jgi:hypothetical protein
MKPILRSYLAEVNMGATAPGNGQNINIQDYPQLRDVYICGLELFDNNQLAISPSGKAVVANLKGLTITLMDKYNMEMLYQYPAFDLNPANIGGFYRNIKPFYLQLTKSYISVLDATTVAANQSVMLNIFYITAKDWDKYKSFYGAGK